MVDIIERLMVCAKYDPDQADAIEEIQQLRGHNRSLQYDFEQVVEERMRLERALKIAAGLISTMEGHSHKHPQDVYKWLVKEAS